MGQTPKMMRGLLTRFLLGAVLVGLPRAAWLAAQEQPQVLTVDQAVKIALANNRTLKITSLQLDDTKESYLAFKTRRYPAFNTYGFRSQVLAHFSFVVQAGQFGTYTGIGPIASISGGVTKQPLTSTP